MAYLHAQVLLGGRGLWLIGGFLLVCHAVQLRFCAGYAVLLVRLTVVCHRTGVVLEMGLVVFPLDYGVDEGWVQCFFFFLVFVVFLAGYMEVVMALPDQR